jgi:hypothetical protein
MAVSVGVGTLVSRPAVRASSTAGDSGTVWGGGGRPIEPDESRRLGVTVPGCP